MDWIDFLKQEIWDEEVNLRAINYSYTDPKTREFYKRYTEAKLMFLKNENELLLKNETP